MAFWDEPIEIRRLWRGPRLLTPMASCACTWIGRVAVILGVGALVLFVVAMLTFMIAVAVLDPAISIGSWAIVGVIAGLNALWNRKHGPPPENPDGTTEGTGIPIPRVPSPLLRVGPTTRDIPAARERYG